MVIFIARWKNYNYQKNKLNFVGAQTQKHRAGRAESLFLTGSTRNTKCYWYRYLPHAYTLTEAAVMIILAHFPYFKNLTIYLRGHLAMCLFPPIMPQSQNSGARSDGRC